MKCFNLIYYDFLSLIYIFFVTTKQYFFAVCCWLLPFIIFPKPFFSVWLKLFFSIFFCLFYLLKRDIKKKMKTDFINTIIQKGKEKLSYFGTAKKKKNVSIFKSIYFGRFECVFYYLKNIFQEGLLNIDIFFPLSFYR